MKLTLTYTQRLNLHALMGAQRANCDELRMYWRLQDLFELTPEEKTVIDYRNIIQKDGQALVQWDAKKELPAREYDLQEAEFQRVAKMVKEWQPGFLIGADRVWIEPLMAQLEAAPASKVNGPASGLGLGGMTPRN